MADVYPANPVFRSSIAEAIMDTERGSPGWLKSLIDAYLDQRRSRYDETWKTIEDLYSKDQEGIAGFMRDPASLKGRRIQPPRVFSHVQGTKSGLYVKNPKFFVKPMTVRQERLAMFGERHLNAEWALDRHLPEQIHLCAGDIPKVGWTFMSTECVAENPEKERRDRRRRRAQARALQQDPITGQVVAAQLASDALGLDSVDFEDRKVTYKRDDKEVYRRISSTRLSYWQVALDPNATSIEDAEWVSRNVIAPLRAVKQCPYFKNTRDLQPNATINGQFAERAVRQISAGGEMTIPDDLQYVSIWENYIRNDDGGFDFKVFAEGHPEWLYEEEERYVLGCPISMGRWNHTGDSIFAPSDIQQILDQIIEESNLRTRLFDATMREMEEVGVFDSNIITEPVISGLTNIPGVGLFFPIPGLANRPREQVIDFMPRTQKSERILAYLAILQKEFDMGTGRGPNQQLSPMKSETSAAEAMEVARRAASLESIKHFWWERFISDVGLKRLQQAAQFYGPEEIGATAGADGAAFWAQEEFTDADIRLGLAVQIEQGSMRQTTDEGRAQVLSAMLMEAFTNPVAAEAYNVPEILKGLNEVRGIQDGSRFLNQDMTQEKIAQMVAAISTMGAGGQGQGSKAAQPGQNPAETVRQGVA